MLLSVSVRFISGLGFIAVFTFAASAKTSVYTIPGEASAVVTTSRDYMTFQLTDVFTNPMELMDDLSAFFGAFGAAPEVAQSPPVRRPLLQIRVEGLLRGHEDSHRGAYCRFFPPWAVEEMSGGLHTDPGRPLFEARDENVTAKLSPFPGDTHIALLDRTATWTLAEMGGTSFHRIGSVRFQFGTTDGRDQAPAAVPVRREPSIPGMLGAVAFIFLSALIIRWKGPRSRDAIVMRAFGMRGYGGWGRLNRLFQLHVRAKFSSGNHPKPFPNVAVSAPPAFRHGDA